MSEYFYTDPLAAAWMAKHHDMQFHTGGGDFCLFELHAGGEGYKENHHGINVKHWYIHPDSVHLLEPRILDVLHQKSNAGGVYSDTMQNDSQLEAARSFIKRGAKIIQRSGKPFFWPEINPPQSATEARA